MSVYYVCNRCHETDLGPTGAGMSCWECATGGKDTSTNADWEDLDFGEMIPGADAFWDMPSQEDYFHCTCCTSTLNQKAGKSRYRSTWESCYFCQADYCGSCTDHTKLAYCKRCNFPFCKESRDSLESCAEFNLNSLGYCRDCYKTKAIKGTHCF